MAAALQRGGQTDPAAAATVAPGGRHYGMRGRPYLAWGAGGRGAGGGGTGVDVGKGSVRIEGKGRTWR